MAASLYPNQYLSHWHASLACIAGHIQCVAYRHHTSAKMQNFLHFVIWQNTSSYPFIVVVLQKKIPEKFLSITKICKTAANTEPFLFLVNCVQGWQHRQIPITINPLARFFSLDSWSHSMCSLPSSHLRKNVKLPSLGDLAKHFLLPSPCRTSKNTGKVFEYHRNMQNSSNYRTIFNFGQCFACMASSF